MKIGIDLLPLQSDPKRRGISNFVYNLIRELIKNDTTNEFYLYNAKKVTLDFVSAGDLRIRLINSEISIKESENLDLFIFTSMFDFEKKFTEPSTLACKTIVIVYDIIPIILWDNYIEFFPNETKLEYFRRINSIRKCDKILTISQSVKKDLVEILEIPEHAVDVIYAGIDHNGDISDTDHQSFKELKQKFGIKNSFIFSVPSMDFRKNIFGLIDAYSLLPEKTRSRFQLVISNEITEDYKKLLCDHAAQQNITLDELILTNYVTEVELKILYKNSSLFVFPSFNEGFGLPVLEAMYYGVPVITSNTSSLPEVVGDAGILVNPYHTHEISRAMEKILTDPGLQNELANKAKIQARQFSWEKTAALAQASCTAYLAEKKMIRLGLVTPWNTKCGIAEYSRYLVENISEVRIFILAHYEHKPVFHDGLNVERCWSMGSDDYNHLFTTIVKNNLDVVHIEFNYSLFDLPNLIRLKNRLTEKGIKIIITFHATQDVTIGDKSISLSEYVPDLQTFDLIIVHTEGDKKRLEDSGLTATLLPQGIKTFDPVPVTKIRDHLTIQGPVIAVFGFLLPHKGIFESIGAISIVKKEYPDIVFLVVSALYPIDESQQYLDKCRQEVRKLGLEKNVHFFSEFMNDTQSNAILQASDIIVMPYQETQESSSAATKFALSAKKPVIVTDIPIFHEYQDEVYKVRACSSVDIADGIRNLLNHEDLQLRLVNSVEKRIAAENWGMITRKYEKMLNSFF